MVQCNANLTYKGLFYSVQCNANLTSNQGCLATIQSRLELKFRTSVRAGYEWGGAYPCPSNRSVMQAKLLLSLRGSNIFKPTEAQVRYLKQALSPLILMNTIIGIGLGSDFVLDLFIGIQPLLVQKRDVPGWVFASVVTRTDFASSSTTADYRWMRQH